MFFEVISSIEKTETIAAQKSIHDLARLNKMYGKGRWRKMKGFAMIRLEDGTIHRAELHWYEAHGIGRREIKFKLPFLD